MKSNKPYMVRAIHEWILDNDCTPYVVLVSDFPGVNVPSSFVVDGQITLNLAPVAIRGLSISNDVISFSTRFKGHATDISAPVESISAIFAKENGQGMGFEVILPSDPEPDGHLDAPVKGPPLKIVK